MTRRATVIAAIALATQGVSGLSAAPAAASGIACDSLTFSPVYVRDRTAFCVHRPGGEQAQHLAVTTNGGRSWQRAKEEGLVRTPDRPTIGVSLSPRFATDRMLFVIAGSGTYVSTDLGATFRLLDGLATGGAPHDPVPFVSAPLPEAAPLLGAEPQVYLAHAGRVPARIDAVRGTHEPAVGTPDRLLGFASVSPTAPPVAFSYRSVGTTLTSVATTCTATLACTGVPFTFPEGLAFADYPELWARSTGDGKTLVVRMRHDGGDRNTAHLWRSTDGGRTFAEWTSVDAVLKPANAVSTFAAPRVSVAADPRSPSTMYLRIGVGPTERGWPRGGPPAEQLFRSADGGRSWRRVGWQLGTGQPGRRGTLPWRGAVNGLDGGGIVVAPDGTLFALGSAVDATRTNTVWCSRDGGVRWRTYC